jgi:antitoxin StbD
MWIFNQTVHFMTHLILAETSASVSELKRNPFATVAAGEGFPVVILHRNAPAFYCVPAKAFGALLDRILDLELSANIDARSDGTVINLSIGGLQA